MKKVLISAVLLSSLIGQVNITDAQGQVKPCYTASKVQIKTPNMLNGKTVNAIKSGKYSFNGVKLDMTYPSVKKLLGKPNKEIVQQNQFGKMITLKYNNLSVYFLSNNRYAKAEKTKVIDIEYQFPTQSKLELKKIQSYYGKPKDVTTGVEDKDSQYDNFMFNYKKLGKLWILKTISLQSLNEPVINEETMGKNMRKTKIAHNGEYTITNSDIKHMAKGTFALKGAKLNMTYNAATKAIGQSLEDRTVITPNGTRIHQDYAFGEVNLEYKANDCFSAPVLKQMLFDYQMRGLTFSKIERLVGKPNRTVNGKMDTTYVDDKEIKVRTRTNTYGHLIAKGEYYKGQWHVTEVQYK